MRLDSEYSYIYLCIELYLDGCFRDQIANSRVEVKDRYIAIIMVTPSIAMHRFQSFKPINITCDMFDNPTCTKTVINKRKRTHRVVKVVRK